MVSRGIFLHCCWWMARDQELYPSQISPGQLLYQLVGDRQPIYQNLPPNLFELDQFVISPRGFDGELCALGRVGP